MFDEIQKEIDLHNEGEAEKAELEVVNEIPILVIDGRAITEGYSEVLQRLKQINRELGNYY